MRKGEGRAGVAAEVLKVGNRGWASASGVEARDPMTKVVSRILFE